MMRTASVTMLLTLGVTAQAQVGDVKAAPVSYEYHPYARLTSAPAGSADAEVGLQIFRVGLTVPVVLDGGATVLLPGVRYQLMDVTMRDAGPGLSLESLHAMMLSAGVVRRLGERWAVIAIVGGGLASDLSGSLGGDDVALGAQLMGTWTIAPRFTLGAGVTVDRRAGDVTPLPLLAIDWQPTDDFMVRGILPASLSVRYRPLRRLTLSLEGALESERYHVSADAAGVEHAAVTYSGAKLGAGATVHWSRSVHTHLYGGAALRRRFERQGGDVDLANGPFAGVEVWVGPSGWSDADAAPER